MKPIFCMTAMLLAALAAADAFADSLFKQQTARDGALITEKRDRFGVGDIITVTVNEIIQSTAQSSVNTKKESDVATQTPESGNELLTGEDSLFKIKPGELPNWNFDTKNETKNVGTSRRTFTLKTNVACTVVEVLPNENLRLQGTKTISMNREDSILSVSGIIRSKDVSTAHTVDSRQIADASILLSGKGPLWNNQRRGWATRLLDWIAP